MSESQTIRFRKACSARYSFRPSLFERIETAVGTAIVGGGLLGLVVAVIGSVL